MGEEHWIEDLNQEGYCSLECWVAQNVLLLSECLHFILVAHCRLGLPLASLLSWQAWLVEPCMICRGPLGQRDRDGESKRVLLLGVSNLHAGQHEDGCSQQEGKM